jgi:hypothetical protein
MFEEDTYFNVEFGNTRLLMRHWLKNMAALGQVDTTVTADVPTFAVFKGPKGKTYSAYNLSSSAKEVSFSDGQKLKLKPWALGMKVSK